MMSTEGVHEANKLRKKWMEIPDLSLRGEWLVNDKAVVKNKKAKDEGENERRRGQWRERKKKEREKGTQMCTHVQA